MEEKKIPAPTVNRQARRIAASEQRRRNKHSRKVKNSNRIVTDDQIIYKDDSYKDKSKKVFTHGMQYAKERINAAKQKFDLPEKINTCMRPLQRLFGLTRSRSTCLIINRDGRFRQFMPDVPPVHKIYVHGCIARVLVSKVCMLVRITKNYTSDNDWIDGSWAITPAEYRMMQATTIQHMRRRPWFFLHRYWYEINFDGRVQPAHLLYDYELNPTAKKTRLWVTREYVPVAKTDKFNDYFRFWKKKPRKPDNHKTDET